MATPILALILACGLAPAPQDQEQIQKLRELSGKPA